MWDKVERVGMGMLAVGFGLLAIACTLPTMVVANISMWFIGIGVILYGIATTNNT